MVQDKNITKIVINAKTALKLQLKTSIKIVLLSSQKDVKVKKI